MIAGCGLSARAANCDPPPSGMVGWWPGEGNASDIVSNHNGTLLGGATANTPGVVGLAFSFDGTNGYASIPDSPALRPANVTVECWIRFRSLLSQSNARPGHQYIVFKQNTRSGNFEGYGLGKDTDGPGGLHRLYFNASSAGGVEAVANSVTVVTTNVWYYVAGVRSSTSIAIYVNGVLEASTPDTNPQNYGTLPLYFGTSGQSYWNGMFSGDLDEVSIYNRALSASEIAAIYAAGAAGKCKGLSGPIVLTPPANQTAAVGANTGFSVTATGSAPLSYQWQFNGSAISAATTTILSLNNVQTSDSGNYAVVVTNSVGSVTSAVAVLTVLMPPGITSQPVGQTNAAGGTVNLSATASGSAPLGYQWLFNGANVVNGSRISGATSSALAISNLQPTDGGNYALVVSNAVGVVTSSVANVTVLGPPAITGQPASQSVAAGSTVGFNVVATGTLPLSYQWLFNGVTLSDGGQYGGSASSALFVTNVQPANAGNYSVVVTNVAGAVTSAVAVLGVIVPGSCDPPPSGLVGWWPGDGSPTNYFGTNNGTLQGGATASASGMVSQCFSLNGTSAYVSVPDSPILRPTNLTIEAWVNFSSLNSSGTAPAGEQYMVFKQNTRSGNFEGYFLGKARGAGGDYFAFSVSSSAGVTAEVDSGAIIQTGVWYHVAAVRGSNFVQLYVNGQMVSQTAVSFPQNYGTLPLYFGTSGQSYWDGKLAGLLDEVSIYNRPLSAAEILAIYNAGSAGKCKLSSGLAITGQPQSQTVAVGANPAFNVTATGSAPFSYQWQFNGSAISGATTTILSLNNVQTTDSGNYTVVVTNTVGSVTSAVAVLTVLVPPSITTEPVGQTNVAGSILNLGASASGSAPLGYQWLFNGANVANGGRVSGATSPALAISNVQSTDGGNYALVVSNAVGVVTSAVASVTVLGPPVVTGPPASQSVTAGASVSFNVTATGTPPLSYQWLFNGAALSDGSQFGGSATASLSIISVQGTNAGNYSVVVTNVAGSVTSAVAVLSVSVPGSCDPPPSGLVGWWPGDGSATNYLGTNNGTLQGGASAGAVGMVAQCFSLDGTNGYVSVPDSAILRPTNLTIEAWVNFSSLDTPGTASVGEQYIVFKQNTRSGNFEGYFLGKARGANGDYFVFNVSSSAGVSVEVDSAPTIQTGVWYHVAGMRDASNLYLYLNGQLVSQTPVGFPQNYGTLPLYFGSSGQSFWDRKFAGLLDEVSIYNRALSAAEILAIYNAGSAGKCKAAGVLAITASLRVKRCCGQQRHFQRDGHRERAAQLPVAVQRFDDFGSDDHDPDVERCANDGWWELHRGGHQFERFGDSP